MVRMVPNLWRVAWLLFPVLFQNPLSQYQHQPRYFLDSGDVRVLKLVLTCAHEGHLHHQLPMVLGRLVRTYCLTRFRKPKILPTLYNGSVPVCSNAHGAW